ncbi:MAG: peptidylprolyl isomerase [Chloroflexi bacterium]|nr:peptidylprolyl isomerase [Chloroflexota bacterium]
MRRASREEKRVAESALDAIDEFIAQQSIDRSNPRWRTQLNRPPQVRFDKGSAYFWDLETNVGALSVRLMPDVAPMHVSSTIYLTRLGFYDGLSFHRVITQFMAQGGCPLGTGTGGPGYQYAGEFNGGVRHDRPGLLSMANAGPNTDGSQFFLTFVPTPWLDGNHTIFGEVVEGMETLQALEARGSQGGATSEPLEISSASIRVE